MSRSLARRLLVVPACPAPQAPSTGAAAAGHELVALTSMHEHCTCLAGMQVDTGHRAQQRAPRNLGSRHNQLPVHQAGRRQLCAAARSAPLTGLAGVYVTRTHLHLPQARTCALPAVPPLLPTLPVSACRFYVADRYWHDITLAIFAENTVRTVYPRPTASTVGRPSAPLQPPPKPRRQRRTRPWSKRLPAPHASLEATQAHVWRVVDAPPLC